MIGPEGVADAARLDLERRLPERFAVLRARLGLSDTDPGLPATGPALVLAQERWRLAVGEYPAVFVIVMRATAFELLEVDAPSPAPSLYLARRYRVRYPVRVFGWARGQQEADTDVNRKRLALALRETLLVGVPFGAMVPDSYSEAFSDVDGGDGPDVAVTQAGALIEYAVDVEELLEVGSEAGTVGTAVATARPAGYAATGRGTVHPEALA